MHKYQEKSTWIDTSNDHWTWLTLTLFLKSQTISTWQWTRAIDLQKWTSVIIIAAIAIFVVHRPWLMTSRPFNNQFRMHLSYWPRQQKFTDKQLFHRSIGKCNCWQLIWIWNQWDVGTKINRINVVQSPIIHSTISLIRHNCVWTFIVAHHMHCSMLIAHAKHRTANHHFSFYVDLSICCINRKLINTLSVNCVYIRIMLRSHNETK